MQLQGKIIWLIGASGGIGGALLPQLLEEGARVAISGRNAGALHALAERCDGRGASIHIQPVDVTDDEQMTAAAHQIRAQFGAINILLYGAGTWAPVDVNDFHVANVERDVDVNFVGLVRAIAGVLPDMLSRRSGEIVAIASLSAYGALPRAEAYGATKAAVNYFLQSLQFDLARSGVGVTTVNPGFVRTDLTAHNDFPMPFLMKPEQAATAIVRGLLAGNTEIHFPRRLSVPLKLFTALPRPAYDWLVMHLLKR